MKYLTLTLGLLLFASQAYAQSTYRAQFNASPDHARQEHGVAVLTKYEVLVYRQTDPNVIIATVDVGKPTPVNDDMIIANVDGPFKLLPAGNDYIARVRAVGPGGAVVSPMSDPFPLQPAAPVGWPTQMKPQVGRSVGQ